MKTTTRWFDHRGRSPEVARATVKALAMFPFSEEVVLSMPITTGDIMLAAAEMRSLIDAMRNEIAFRRKSHFDAVCCIRTCGEALHATFGVRHRLISEPLWEWHTSRHGLDVHGYLVASNIAPKVVAERILAFPLSAEGSPDDDAAKIIDTHLTLNGGLWLIKYGKPILDHEGFTLSGIQEGRERALDEGEGDEQPEP